ncbi:MAG: SCO family protein [Pseudomonadota bacterium]
MLDKIPASLRFGLVAAVAAALGLTLGVMLMKPKALSIESGTLLQPPRELPAFTLTDLNNQPFTNASLQGHWTVVFAGFTTCPDVCPTTLTLMKNVLAELGPLASEVQMLLLSIDPERDTPEKLKSYVQYFDPRFLGATGPNQELDKLARAMSFVYAKVPGSTPETYTMDHSSALMLINPQGQLAGFFTTPHVKKPLASDLSNLIKKK